MNRNTFVLGGLATAVVASAASATTFTGAGGTIPDSNPAGFTSMITVNDDFFVGDITVDLVGLTHTWIGDLVVTLTHVTDGKTQNLFNRVGKTDATTGFGDSSNLGGTYSFNDSYVGNLWTAAAGGGTDFVVPPGNYFASAPLTGAKVTLLSQFGSTNAKGTWQLSIVDLAGGDTGTLGSWNLSFVKSPVPAPGALALLGLAGLTGGRRRRA